MLGRICAAAALLQHHVEMETQAHLLVKPTTAIAGERVDRTVPKVITTSLSCTAC